jgi:hypothetical protein
MELLLQSVLLLVVSVVGWEISSRIKVPPSCSTSYNYYLVLCNLSPRGLSSTTFRLKTFCTEAVVLLVQLFSLVFRECLSR